MLSQVPKDCQGKLLTIAEAGLFTGRMHFLSPNQQCQSTGWLVFNGTFNTK